MGTRPVAIGFAAVFFITVAAAPDGHELTFARRVEAQRALEQVYWNYRIWPVEDGPVKPSLSEVVTDDAIELKVRDYLAKSEALHLTAQDLKSEIERMARESKRPGVLRELLAALNDDPFLIAECLARPALTERLSRDAAPVLDVRGPLSLEATVESDYRDVALPALAPAACPSADLWSPTSQVGAPIARYGHTAVWTGAEMIVWGGNTDAGGSTNTGGRYDPATDTWAATSTGAGTPSVRMLHAAVWTGTRMLIWGGHDGTNTTLNTGARYDPVTDTWLATSTGAGVPEARSGPSMVWTGTEAIVWGGGSQLSTPLQTGGRYNPATDTWTPTSIGAGVPVGRFRHTAVWTGSAMIVWGGFAPGGRTNTGGRYTPATDSWVATSTGANVPLGREEHTAVWTGSRMIVWGGEAGNFPSAIVNTGGRYDPASNTWTATGTSGAPDARQLHTAVATNMQMIVWGGSISDFPFFLGTGGRYDVATDSWLPTSTTAAPTPRFEHTAVYTGPEDALMIVWGGSGAGNSTNSGGVYCTIACSNPPTWYRDADGDGFGNPPVTVAACEQPVGYVANNSDCNDANPNVYPGAPEICDGLKDNCSAGGPNPPTNERDHDNDGSPACADCNDSNVAVYPGAPQVCGDGLNNDCTHPSWPALTGTNELDGDGDGLTGCAGDCDNTNAAIRPGAPQVCDGVNNDCNHPSWPGLSGTNEGDGDGDTFSPCGGDCDDGHAAVRPGGPQICDGLNDDCNDPSWPAITGTNEVDGDADGASACAGDCNGADPDVYTGAAELCDAYDNDCDGQLDDDPACDRLCDTPEGIGKHPISSDGGDFARIVWTGAEYGAVWSAVHQPGSIDEVWFARIDTAGNRIGTPVPIASSPPGASLGIPRPSIAWTGTEYAVVWGDRRDGNAEIYFARISASGVKIGIDRRITTGSGLSYAPVLVWTGSSYGVSWIDDVCFNNLGTVRFARLDALGNKAGSDVNVTSGCRSDTTKLVWNGAGYGIAWRDFNTLHLYFARFDAAGTKIGGDVQVTDPGAQPTIDASLVWTGSGYGIAWYTSTDGIHFRRLDASGTKIGGELHLSASTSVNTPDLAWTGLRYGVTWLENGAIKLAQIDSNGVQVGVTITAEAQPGGTSLQWSGSSYGLASDATSGITFTPVSCNCANPDHLDSDRDGIGDPCDPDDDNDGVLDVTDVCRVVPDPAQADLDGDGVGDRCDNCKATVNPGQSDVDGDSHGDVCDNCPTDSNFGLADLDQDGQGDRCDLDDGLIYLFTTASIRMEWQNEQGFAPWNAYKGSLAVLKSTGVYTQAPGSNALAARACGLGTTSVDDPAPPPAGTSAFFLVTGMAGGVESSLGTNSAGVPRPNANPCP